MELEAANQAAAEERKQEARQRREAQRIEREAHADSMAAEYLPRFKKTVTDRVYAKAWEDGHAEGLENVESHYDDLAALILFAFNA